MLWLYWPKIVYCPKRTNLNQLNNEKRRRNKTIGSEFSNNIHVASIIFIVVLSFFSAATISSLFLLESNIYLLITYRDRCEMWAPAYGLIAKLVFIFRLLTEKLRVPHGGNRETTLNTHIWVHDSTWRTFQSLTEFDFAFFFFFFI